MCTKFPTSSSRTRKERLPYHPAQAEAQYYTWDLDNS